MSMRPFLKTLSDKSGKSSKPNLGVFFLILIIIIQGLFLYKAYGPKKKISAKPLSKTAPVEPAPAKTVLPEHPKVQPAETPPQKQGKIALIIDDSGYSRHDCEKLAQIQVPVTISILPQLAHSKEVDACASGQGKEVMLHMPMEPHVFKEKYPVDYFIKTNMSSAQIVKRLSDALLSVPHAAGINNHEGSKATEDSRVMYIVFKELAKRGLFFVDSRVTNKSVCKVLAEKLDLPFTGRDIFLDNINEKSAIEKEFANLAAKAKSRGTVIAIGHARTKSWPVIIEQVKALSEEGYEFVTVRDMIKARNP